MRWPTDALRCAPASGRITIEAQLLGDQVRVSVRDTGAGIASEDLPYAFDRFYRAEKSRARADGGPGRGWPSPAIWSRPMGAHRSREPAQPGIPAPLRPPHRLPPLSGVFQFFRATRIQ
ncbi:MAG: hypothetical protein J7452_05885 [Thermoflexus sp.]|nr:hypothetical protein [Thermoflexus sp.]